jgi:acetaldehyde dehydrogenase/alcohol dehydrogenase
MESGRTPERVDADDGYRTPGLDIDRVMAQAVLAANAFRRLTQEQTDRIVAAVYRACFNSRVRLAKQAWEETQLGRWEDKVIKNVIATRYVFHRSSPGTEPRVVGPPAPPGRYSRSHPSRT